MSKSSSGGFFELGYEYGESLERRRQLKLELEGTA